MKVLFPRSGLVIWSCHQKGYINNCNKDICIYFFRIPKGSLGGQFIYIKQTFAGLVSTLVKRRGAATFQLHRSEPSDTENKHEITPQQACINATNGTVHFRVSF